MSSRQVNIRGDINDFHGPPIDRFRPCGARPAFRPGSPGSPKTAHRAVFRALTAPTEEGFARRFPRSSPDGKGGFRQNCLQFAEGQLRSLAARQRISPCCCEAERDIAERQRAGPASITGAGFAGTCGSPQRNRLRFRPGIATCPSGNSHHPARIPALFSISRIHG